MINYEIIQTGSKGNAVVYHDILMVDCGVSFNKLSKHIDKIEAILLTHEHLDHTNITTIKKIVYEKPSIWWIIPEHLLSFVSGIDFKRTVVISPGKNYLFKHFLISAVILYHNVENVGYRITNTRTKEKLFHATDTYTLEGIMAKDYDLYAIEFNFDEEEIENTIMEKISNGEFSYEIAARENHLSFKKANEWLQQNCKDGSIIVPLHTSSKYLDNNENKKVDINIC